MRSRNLDSREQLAAEVLHELKQPLLGLKAYVQMIRDEGTTQVPVHLLVAQVERMEQIISDFSRLSHDKPAPKERINLTQCVREARKLFELNPESARISLEVDVAPQLDIHGNARLIEQLALNLLCNARDAMSGLGRIKLIVTREAGAAVLYVADWGPGIPLEMRERVFEPYVTGKPRGSGLGLAVCHRIAQEHQAHISLVSPHVLSEHPPPATVFRVAFPSDPSPSTGRKRILIVDDEAIIRMVFKDLMGKECEVVEADTGEEGVSHLRRSNFDLIVTDKNLPGLSGLDLAQEARRIDPKSKVILMTGYPSLITAQQSLELGVIDYLLKPFDDIREVRDKIRATLNAAPAAGFEPANRRVDIYEDNPATARQLTEALALLGVEVHLCSEPEAFGDEAPAGVVVSWDFTRARGPLAVQLGRSAGRGAPFVILAEHLTMETALECLRGGAAACLPKLLSDVKALSRELSRALKLSL